MGTKKNEVAVNGNELQLMDDIVLEALKQGKGRPAVYPDTAEGLETLQNNIVAYFDYVANVNRANESERALVPDVEMLCGYLGITRTTLLTYQKSRGEEWRETIERAKTIIAAYQKQLGLTYKIPPVVLMFNFQNNFGYAPQNAIHVENIQTDAGRKTVSLEEIRQQLGLNNEE